MIRVKAVERKLKFEAGENGAFQYRYVMQAELYSKLTQSKVIEEASLRSGISKGVINASWDAIGQVIRAWLTEGHSVAIPGMGSMRFSLRSTSVEDVNKVASSLITSRRVLFTPTVEIKRELQNTSVSITCIDRDGNVVKRINSADVDDVEDPEDENQNDQGDGTNGGSANGQGEAGADNGSQDNGSQGDGNGGGDNGTGSDEN